MKRTFGLEPNVSEFAKLIDEFEKAMKRKYNPNDPNQIFVGHLGKGLENKWVKADIAAQELFG